MLTPAGEDDSKPRLNDLATPEIDHCACSSLHYSSSKRATTEQHAWGEEGEAAIQNRMALYVRSYLRVRTNLWVCCLLAGVTGIKQQPMEWENGVLVITNWHFRRVDRNSDTYV